MYTRIGINYAAGSVINYVVIIVDWIQVQHTTLLYIFTCDNTERCHAIIRISPPINVDLPRRNTKHRETSRDIAERPSPDDDDRPAKRVHPSPSGPRHPRSRSTGLSD
ncbi:hypothetical protein PUN28_017175 [Cardiocondyla obscurior]|uniref:Uncharacterized protein n=1 Tax=Cardiocondyla obscurior TaxID=286306 RepID=A0AAW2ER26_9HYME